MDDEVTTKEPTSNTLPQAGLAFLAGSLSLYALMKKGNYQMAFLFYSQKGGGLNIYKIQENGERQRRFAIDYHPFWDRKLKESTWKLHYHRGETTSQMKKHRPYEGGW